MPYFRTGTITAAFLSRMAKALWCIALGSAGCL